MHRLILFEGLPGTGKSSLSQSIYLQRCKAGVDVSWFAEDQRPHPLIDDRDLARIERPDELADYAKTRWQQVADNAVKSDSLVVLDAALFGLTLGGLLRLDASPELLTETSEEIDSILAPTDPVMIYLRPHDVQGVFDKMLNVRGQSWTNYMADELSTSSFAVQRNVAGLELVRTYYQELDHLFNLAYERLSLTKYAIDVDHGDFGQMRDQIQTALGNDAPPMVSPSPEWLESLSGTYRSIEDDTSLVLRKEGAELVIDQDQGTRLIHANSNAFMVQGMPVDVTFESQPDGPTRAIFCARTADSVDIPLEWVKE